jgi:hypothetical protein
MKTLLLLISVVLISSCTTIKEIPDHVYNTIDPQHCPSIDNPVHVKKPKYRLTENYLWR